jgi:hypothetical protein
LSYGYCVIYLRMPGKFVEGTPITLIDQREQVRLSFEDGYVDFRPTSDDTFAVQGMTKRAEFVICQGRVYAVEEFPHKELGVGEYAYVIENVNSRLVIVGTERGFDVVEPKDTRRSVHTVDSSEGNCQFLNIGGVLMRAVIEF